ncbi:hypothetical protein [Bacillus methanolicus]|nr:hypothetical protein [Bacillus methanolicus]
MLHIYNDYFLITWDDIDKYVEFLNQDTGQALVDEYAKGLNNSN